LVGVDHRGGQEQPAAQSYRRRGRLRLHVDESGTRPGIRRESKRDVVGAIDRAPLVTPERDLVDDATPTAAAIQYSRGRPRRRIGRAISNLS